MRDQAASPQHQAADKQRRAAQSGARAVGPEQRPDSSWMEPMAVPGGSTSTPRQLFGRNATVVLAPAVSTPGLPEQATARWHTLFGNILRRVRNVIAAHPSPGVLARVRETKNIVERVTREGELVEEKKRATGEILRSERSKHLQRVLSVTGGTDISAVDSPGRCGGPTQVRRSATARLHRSGPRTGECTRPHAPAERPPTYESPRRELTAVYAASVGSVVSRYMPSPSPLKDGAGSGFKVTPVPAGGPTAQQDHIPRQMAVHINDFGSRAGIEHTQPGEAPRRKLPKTARPSNASTRISARPASAGYRHAPS